MYGKILIKAKLKVLTGLHIGGSNNFSAIGAVDSVVIKDAATKQPIIPGSSLKGKLRTLLARSVENSIMLDQPDKDKHEIKRLFGSSERPPVKSRLQFSDAYLLNGDEFKDIGGATEVKFENTINRLTSVANPRQLERVIRGAEFEVAIVYDVDDKGQIEDDFKNISKAISLLHMDYLGGHGTRGYGKVKLCEFEVRSLSLEREDIDVEALKDILRRAEDHALLSI